MQDIMLESVADSLDILMRTVAPEPYTLEKFLVTAQVFHLK